MILAGYDPSRPIVDVPDSRKPREAKTGPAACRFCGCLFTVSPFVPKGIQKIYCSSRCSSFAWSEAKRARRRKP